MLIVVWLKRDLLTLAKPEEKKSANAWDAVIEVIKVIAKFTPPPYRLPVALMMLGAAIMIVPVGIAALAGGVK